MPLILPGNVASATASTTFSVANSCRFNQPDSAKMSITPASDGNKRTWTWSAWIKIGKPGNFGGIFFAGIAGATDNITDIYLDDDGLLYLRDVVSNGVLEYYVSPNRVFRDHSAWYHIVYAVDTTQGTDTNRVKLYINGTQETSLAENTYPDQNYETNINDSTYAHDLGHGLKTNGVSYYFDGYMAEVCFIDGTQYAASDFGEFDEDSPNIWKPKDVSGLTFGTNGFYLDFEDSDNLGNDANGGTDLTETNLAATDQATDTPTNNFCTFNPLIFRTGRTATTITQGNCKAIFSDSGGNTTAWGTILLNHGKWYFEMKVLIANYSHIGTWQTMGAWTNPGVYDAISGLNSYRSDGVSHDENIGTATYGDAWSADDIIGCAFDCDTGTIWFSVGGVWQDSATQAEVVAGTTTNAAFTGKAYSTNGVLAAASGYSGASLEANFGGCSAFAISSGNADDNGYGNFEYDVPTGYYSICTKNLAEFGG